MNLRLIPFFILFFLLLIFPFKKTYSQEAQILTNYLNVRMGPDISYEVITQIHKDEIYPVLEVKEDWVKIQLSHGEGWVSMDYVSLYDPAHQPTDPSNDHEKQTTTVKESHIHVRKGPSITEEIIDYIDQDTTLTIIDEIDDWYEVSYGDQTGYIYRSFFENHKTLEKDWREQTIVIDAGHGGRDIGAIGYHGYYEKDFITLTAKKIKRTLQILGATIYKTRKNDEYIRLGSRPVLANNKDTDIFISLHYNSFDQDPSITGIGTYYEDDYNRELAKAIQNGLIQTTDAHDRGVAKEDFLVLRQNYKPSVLVELGFISNPHKEELLFTDAYQEKLVNGILYGLREYLMEP